VLPATNSSVIEEDRSAVVDFDLLRVWHNLTMGLVAEVGEETKEDEEYHSQA